MTSFSRLAGFVFFVCALAFLSAPLRADPAGLFVHADLPHSFGDGRHNKAGYSLQDRQPLASFKAPDGTLWQVVGYISLNRLPVVQWRHRAPDSEDWSLWARIGQDASVLPATGENWHGFVSLAIDTAGYLHLAYDGRTTISGEFRFYRSDLPIHQGWDGSLINRSDTGLPGWSSSTFSTYWRFSKHPDSGLLTLALRESRRGHALFVLDADTQVWSAFPGTRSSDGRLLTSSGIFAQYVSHDVVFRGDDVFVGFTERQNAGMSNEDLSVIKYDAANGRWQRLDGTVLSIPVLPGEGTIIDPSKTGSMLDQRWDLMVDGHGFVHGFYRRKDDQDFLQIFHFCIDHDDNVHGPLPVTSFTYTDHWRDFRDTGVNLSKPFSFHVGDILYLTWQEENHGQRTRAMASRYPYTDWNPAQQIDDTNLFISNPEFERWAWDSREEIWLTAMPFTTKTPAGRPVAVKRIPLDTLPATLPLLTFDDWVHHFPGLSESERAPLADPAGDGINNLFKYAMDMHPLEDGRGTRAGPDAGGLPWLDRGSNGELLFIHRVNTALQDLELGVQSSDDLSENSWTLETRTIHILEEEGDTQLRGMVFPPDLLDETPLFLRLRVELNP